VRIVEVRLFKTSRLYDRVPMDKRRWGPCSDLANTAKEISNYIAGSRSAAALKVLVRDLGTRKLVDLVHRWSIRPGLVFIVSQRGSVAA
jgi:hypothetical protein